MESMIIIITVPQNSHGTAGVVVSCKIPILATRVRFPGGAHYFSRSGSGKHETTFLRILIHTCNSRNQDFSLHAMCIVGPNVLCHGTLFFRVLIDDSGLSNAKLIVIFKAL